MNRLLVFVLIFIFNIITYADKSAQPVSAEYSRIQADLARGWNTWNTCSVLSHVLLPEGLALNIGIKEYKNGFYLKDALVGRVGENDEQIKPGPHAYDGSYTELLLEWRDIKLKIQSALEGNDLVLLVTPLENQKIPADMILESGFLWNKPGYVIRMDNVLTAYTGEQVIRIYSTKPVKEIPIISAQTAYLAIELNEPVGISVNAYRSVKDIENIIARRKLELENENSKYGQLTEVHKAIQSVMAWDTIYDPIKNRVITPVSRLWNLNGGGYQLFCWDTYFAGYLAALDNKALAYCNVIEITREKSFNGFVPNYAWGNGISSHDRSQPPVGSMVVKELYRIYGDQWLLRDVFNDLLEWNRWWSKNRMNKLGLLSWGSTPYEPLFDNYWETAGVNDTYGGALESGLDNSPMYDGIPFNKEKHIMELADAGLCGLYVMDCDALAQIASVLNKKDEEKELLQRADVIRKNMKKLWDDKQDFYYNLRTDTNEFSNRISPTNFYPLLAKAPAQKQVDRMLEKHFYNPDEFWGDWILPSIARNDPAFHDNDYWRGRIWAPMNFLVYLGLRNYNVPQARKDLADHSVRLLLKEWLSNGHVHENYNAENGLGCDVNRGSDRFYHWGGLLGLIAFIEDGYLPAPELPLTAVGNDLREKKTNETR